VIHFHKQKTPHATLIWTDLSKSIEQVWDLAFFGMMIVERNRYIGAGKKKPCQSSEEE
jgi:hypothetical protein